MCVGSDLFMLSLEAQLLVFWLGSLRVLSTGHSSGLGHARATPASIRACLISFLN